MKTTIALVLSLLFIGSIYAQSWNEVQYNYPDPGGNTSYGKGLAMDAEYTFVGAPTHYNGGGNVTIYKNDYNTDSLLFHQTLSNPDGVMFNGFGCSISIDGNYAVVGANLEKSDTAGSNPIVGAGAAYIFKKDSLGIWSFYQKIVPNTRHIDMRFGREVSISDNRILIGTYYDGMYSFLLNANVEWVQSQNIAGANSVSISGDKAVLGNVTAVDLSTNIMTGIAILYEFDVATDTWLYMDSIKPTDGYASDFFGVSVSINNNRIVVGAVNHSYDLSLNYLEDAGAAYIYEIDNTNTAIFDQKLVAVSRKLDAHFGSAVAIYKNLCTVAAVGDSNTYTPMGGYQSVGASYTYKKSTIWTNVMTEYGAQIGNSFGYSIAINNVFQISSALPYDMAQDNEPNGLIRVFKNDQPLIDTTIIVECNSYTDSNGVYYGASTDFYEAADNNFNSQDVYFNSITINGQISDLLVDSVCSPTYTSPSGNYIYTQDGIYYDTIVNPGSICDSVIRIDLKFTPINTQVLVSGDSLIATTDASIIQYQWLSCDNNYDIVSNETSNIFTPIDSGLYAVELLSSYNCIDTSACYFVTIINSIENNLSNSLNVYPNPSNGNVNIDFEKEEEFISLSIENLLGGIVYKKEYNNTKNINIKLNASNGVYILQMVNKQGQSASMKIIVE